MRRQRSLDIGLAAVLVLALGACGGASGSSGASSSAQTGGSAGEGSLSAGASESVVVGEGEEWLAFQWLDRGGGDGIFLARPDGSGYHQLARDMPGHELHPDWSPDGERIAFVHFTPADLSELWVVNADGSGLELLLSCELPCNSFGYPDWDADGGRSTSVRTRTRRLDSHRPRSSSRALTWRRATWTCSSLAKMG